MVISLELLQQYLRLKRRNNASQTRGTCERTLTPQSYPWLTTLSNTCCISSHQEEYRILAVLSRSQHTES